MTWSQQIRNEMIKLGLDINEEIKVDGQRHTYRSTSDINCGYIISIEKRICHITNFKSDITKVLELTGNPPFVKKALEKSDLKQKKSIEDIQNLFDTLPFADPNHHYCKKKKIDIVGLNIRQQDDCLVIPVNDINGRVQTFQTISQSGDKLFKKGFSKAKHFHILTNGNPKRKVIFVEGFATGVTLFNLLKEEHDVVVTFDCVNLYHVAKQLITKYKESIIAADNDHYKKANAGIEAAKEASLKLNIPYTYPEFFQPESKSSDFNDLYCQFGNTEVSRQFRRNIQRPTPKHEIISKEIKDTLDENNYTEFLQKINSAFLNTLQINKLLIQISKEIKVSVADLKKELKASNPNPQKQEEWAKLILEKVGTDNIISSKGKVYIRKSQVLWNEAEDNELHRLIAKYKPSECFNINHIKSVKGILKYLIKEDDNFFTLDPFKIILPFKNTTLEFNFKTYEFEPLHSDTIYNTTYQIPHNYNDEAKCPKFTKFLRSVYTNDFDKGKKVIHSYEIIGMSLIPNRLFESAFFLLGEGSNGKSVYTKILSQIVGNKHTSNVNPIDLDCGFKRDQLHNKSLNLVNELSQSKELPCAIIKAFISAEDIDAAPKYGKGYSFTPTCTLVFGTNYLPPFNDKSNGTTRKFNILTFNEIFLDITDFEKLSEAEQENFQKKDLNLEKKLVLEIEGIIVLALEAISRAIKRNELTQCSSSEEAISQWKKENNHVLQFIEDCFSNTEVDRASFDEIFQKYQRYCKNNGLYRNLLTSRQLMKELRKDKFVDCKILVNKKQKRALLGPKI